MQQQGTATGTYHTLQRLGWSFGSTGHSRFDQVIPNLILQAIRSCDVLIINCAGQCGVLRAIRLVKVYTHTTSD